MCAKSWAARRTARKFGGTIADNHINYLLITHDILSAVNIRSNNFLFFLSKPYLVLPHRYLARLCQLIYFIVDVVAQIGHITLIGSEVK